MPIISLNRTEFTKKEMAVLQPFLQFPDDDDVSVLTLYSSDENKEFSLFREEDLSGKPFYCCIQMSTYDYERCWYSDSLDELINYLLLGGQMERRPET